MCSFPLVGRHDLALADLEAATHMADEMKDAAPAPSWLPVIDAYLKSDRKRLAGVEGRHARLAALLSMMTIEYPHRTRVIAQAAHDLAVRDADCALAYDAICQNGQLGELHVATVAGPDAFTKLFPTKLKSLKSLPETVKQALDKGRAEPDLVATLDQAGRPGEDRDEPSWGVLAHLAHEARFVHAYWRLHFMANMWHVPAFEALEGFRTLVAGHRFFPYLEFIVHPRREGAPALSAMAERLDLAEMELTERPLIDALREIKHPAGEDGWRSAMLQVSLLSRDLAQRLQQTNAARDHAARILLNISPYSAHAMGVLIEVAWDQVKGEVPAWRQKVGEAPALIAALGRKHAELREYDEAEKDLRRYIEISPDPLWASGSAKQALESLEQAARAQPTAANAIAAFLLADELGETAHRDQLLEELCTKLQRQVPRMVAIARMMRELLAGGGKGALDLAAVDKVLGDMPAKTRGNAEFLVGRFLLNRGQQESARKYLQRAAESGRTDPGLRQIAVDSMRPPGAKNAD